MHKMLGVFAVGVIALATACSGSSSPANKANGQGSGGSSASASASPSANPSATGSAAPSGSPAAKPIPATGHTVTSGPGSKPPGSPTGFTRAGTYTYDISGTASTKLGTQKISGTDTFAVDPPNGTEQKTTQANKQGSRNQILDVRSTGLFLVDLNIDEPGFKEDFKPVGTAMYFPGNYKVGSAWKWTARSTDGKYTLTDSSKITSTANVVIGGKSIPTLIVDSVLHFTGNGLDLTDNQRDWVSTAYALIVKEHLAAKGNASGITFTSDETRTIRSTTPSSG